MLEMHGALERISQSSTLQSPRSDSLSHRSLDRWFVMHNITASPTLQDLYDLQIDIDYECLRHSNDVESDSPANSYSGVDSLARLAIKLSGPLSQLDHPGTEMFQNAQLRALVSVLALLHYKGVRSLNTTLWDELRSTNILRHFEAIAFRRGSVSNKMLNERIRHAPNTYLIQLAAQYVSFWRRGDSFWSSIVTPATKILFGVVSVVSPP